MALHPIDEEKGQTNLARPRTRMTADVIASEKSISATSSPQLSRDSTIVASLSSPELESDRLTRTDSFWSRRVNSFRSTLGIETAGKRRNSKDCENFDEDDDSDDEDRSGTFIRKIHKQPNGYPRMATFLDSDESFMIFRRFGYLQTRLILDRQDELANLEMDLDLMEHREAANPKTAGRLTSRRYASPEKKALFDQIETKWNGYCQLLTNASKMTGLNRPTDEEHKSIEYWMNNVKPVVASEARFVRCKEDLVILGTGREHAWLDSGIEKFLKWVGWAPLRRLFQSKETREKCDGQDGTILYTRSRIDNFVVMLILLMILALLVVPIWVLFKLSDPERGPQPKDSRKTSVECIGVLLVSTMAFSACISLFTRARRHEILAASAAYCAVLVVFIGNLNQNLG